MSRDETWSYKNGEVYNQAGETILSLERDGIIRNHDDGHLMAAAPELLRLLEKVADRDATVKWDLWKIACKWTPLLDAKGRKELRKCANGTLDKDTVSNACLFDITVRRETRDFWEGWRRHTLPDPDPTVTLTVFLKDGRVIVRSISEQEK